MKKTLIALTMTLIATQSFADGMDHSKMDHGSHEHGAMNHDTMDHSKMDHGMMNMEGMSAVGMPAAGTKPDKVVHVILKDDMTISFKRDVEIKPNDVVQFVVMNTGKDDHEFVIGSPAEQIAHRKMMENPTEDHDHHSMGNVLYLKPGKAGQLTWHFHGEKEIEFACNIPDHAEDGMTKTIVLK